MLSSFHLLSLVTDDWTFNLFSIDSDDDGRLAISLCGLITDHASHELLGFFVSRNTVELHLFGAAIPLFVRR